MQLVKKIIAMFRTSAPLGDRGSTPPLKGAGGCCLTTPPPLLRGEEPKRSGSATPPLKGARGMFSKTQNNTLYTYKYDWKMNFMYVLKLKDILHKHEKFLINNFHRYTFVLQYIYNQNSILTHLYVKRL